MICLRTKCPCSPLSAVPQWSHHRHLYLLLLFIPLSVDHLFSPRIMVSAYYSLSGYVFCLFSLLTMCVYVYCLFWHLDFPKKILLLWSATTQYGKHLFKKILQSQIKDSCLWVRSLPLILLAEAWEVGSYSTKFAYLCIWNLLQMLNCCQSTDYKLKS